MPSQALPGYERDPYLTTLATRVVSTGEEKGRPFAVLEDTILYPEGGGQPPDHGTVGDIAVVDVQKREGLVRHYLASPAPTGDVVVRLDWERRFDHMQQHTGQHLLSAVAQDAFGFATTAFHLGPATCDVELAAPRLPAETLLALEEAVATAIRKALPVTPRRVTLEEYAALTVRTRGLPEGHQGDVRLVEIAGLDRNTCGGTHLRSTAEIELVKLLDTEAIRGGTRLFFVAGRRARLRFASHEKRNAQLRVLLGAPDDGIASVVEGKLAEAKATERKVRALLEEVAAASATSLVSSTDRVVSAGFDGKDAAFLASVAKALSERIGDRVALVVASGPGGASFVLVAGETAPIDTAAAGPRVAELLGGKGGGRGKLFQGKATAPERREEAAAFLRSLFPPG